MAKFKVKQLVLCEVRVWYELEADTHELALEMVSDIECPTCADGRDFEINSDVEVLSTLVTGVKDE